MAEHTVVAQFLYILFSTLLIIHMDDENTLKLLFVTL